ncbi:MAG TPA: hypothetical protein VGO58_10870 [Chitinophagaceae bacterium]|jgi:hypothetical protein|nr:hypothetical protein [Chitinophagaceae bacterium]
MIRKVPLVIAIVACIFHSCKPADSKPGNMADDVCNCFQGIVANLSAETKEMVIGAAHTNEPREYITKYLGSLNEEKKQQVGREMRASRVDEKTNPGTMRCLEKVELKYTEQFKPDETESVWKMIKELEKKKECTIAASMLRLGLVIQGKPEQEK